MPYVVDVTLEEVVCNVRAAPRSSITVGAVGEVASKFGASGTAGLGRDVVVALGR